MTYDFISVVHSSSSQSKPHPNLHQCPSPSTTTKTTTLTRTSINVILRLTPRHATATPTILSLHALCALRFPVFLETNQNKTELVREPRAFPRLVINPEVKDIDGFTFDDFTIEGYKPHKRIKMQMAV